MIRNRNEDKFRILYIGVVRKRDNSNFLFIAPEEFTSTPILSFLKACPKSIIQFGKAFEYFENAIKYQYQVPIEFNIVFDKDFQLVFNYLSFNKQIKVFCIDKSADKLDKIIDKINSLNSFNLIFLYGTLDSPTILNKYELSDNTKWVRSPRDILSKIQNNKDEIVKHIPEVNDLSLTFTEPISGLNRQYLFAPTANNFFTINQFNCDIWQNEDFHSEKSESTRELEELRVDSHTAFKNADSYQRQSLLLDQIKRIDNIFYYVHKEHAIKVNKVDYLLSPLIISYPHHNPSAKKILLELPSQRKKRKKLVKLLTLEQSSNYVMSNVESSLVQELGDEVVLGIINLLKLRTSFTDDVLYLHSTFLNSPVLRLPLIGKSINRELSFFQPSFFQGILRKGFKGRILKTIENLGNKLSKKVSPEILRYIERRKGQLIAISDLPIEWLSINGIPLCFTHDVCRIPETPMAGVLSHYSTNISALMEIDSNIMNKVLVVYGTDEPRFRVWQDIVEKHKKDLGFNSILCNNIDEVKAAIDRFKPEILIFDCHGGVDKKDFSSYLQIGEERLTNDIVVDLKITAPILFLSACGTAPNYGFYNSIAQGFFEAGAIVVTTTFLPIDINYGSVLYFRLLNNLKFASSNAIHQNWLSFVSHLVRSSSVLNSYNYLRHIESVSEKEMIDLFVEIKQELLIFEKRRDIYRKMDERVSKFSGEITNSFSKLIPEHLFYSHLGRADLITFQSWKEEKLKNN